MEDYKEKYEMALEGIQEILSSGQDSIKMPQLQLRLQGIFPELKESEDEKIREMLIDSFTRADMGGEIYGKGVTYKQVIAWLEKQGEQKPIMNVPTREVILSIWDLGNEWKELTNGSISTEYGTQLDYIQKHWYESEYYLKKPPVIDFNANDWYVSKVDGKIHNIYYSVDKIEPKFKVGAWVVNRFGDVWHIDSFDSKNYQVSNGDKYCYFPIKKQNEMHLWTTQDAKDGDVLACGDKVTDCPFIFHNLSEELNPRSYCGVAKCQQFQYNDENCGFWCHSDEVRPATKEQRELLFKKMKEAGYTWDDEKKELKKIHVIDDGKAEMDYCFTKMMAGEKVSPAWSDEDEKMCQETIDWFEKKCFPYALEEENPASESIKWLKSLKGRITWKPSEEQMKTLEYYMHTLLATEHKEVLFGLYNDLKKL